MDRAYTPIGSLLEQAAGIVRRSKEAAGTLELAKSYKGKANRKTDKVCRF